MLNYGDIVIGKWNKNKYIVLEVIGQGGIGIVYKVRDANGIICALKLSENMSSITREYDIMKRLKKHISIPNVYEIDDCIINNETLYFFTMDYIEGRSLKNIVKNDKFDIKKILGISMILLKLLIEVYNIGYIYSDIKLDNILIDRVRKKIIFIDFGCVVEKNYSLREYTPTYNINSWGIDGNSSFDTMMIFSVTMLIVSMLFKEEFNPLTNTLEKIIHKIESLNIDKKVKCFIISGLKLKYRDIKAYQIDLKNILVNYGNIVIPKNRYTKAIDIMFIASICLFLIVIAWGISL